MRRMSEVLGIVLGCVLCGVSLADDGGKQRPAYDPKQLFKRGDTNKDGKLSLEEFSKLMQLSRALKGQPDKIKRLFNYLDANKDGFLTFDEFKKITELGNRPKAEEPKTPMPAAPEKPATAEGIAFFEKKIRPVLVEKCYQCHSAKAKKIRGNLVLDTREGTRKGGDLGPAVVPGNLKDSLLIQALSHKNDALKMPPKDKLPVEVIADFEAWVRIGAPDPREGVTKIVQNEIDVEKGRTFWAFQPPVKKAAPAVKDSAWPRTFIDQFVLAGLETKSLAPVRDSDRPALLRRAAFDLIGLPPSMEEIEAFVKDASPGAFEKVVDRLLASPQFGERWGRHWLDVARFAESSGKQANMAYPHAWRYRDYVIAAFNADKPYDQFVREQLAGDLLPAESDRQKAEQLVATGFLAIGSKNHNDRSRQQFLMDLADEQIDATTTAFLGMTVACALPRSQIRSDPDEGLLRPRRHLHQHGDQLRNDSHRAEQPPQPARGAAEDGRRGGGASSSDEGRPGRDPQADCRVERQTEEKRRQARHRRRGHSPASNREPGEPVYALRG